MNDALLTKLGLQRWLRDETVPGVVAGDEAAVGEGAHVTVRCPIDGTVLAQVAEATPAQVASTIARSREAFAAWRQYPAPARGELVRRIGEIARDHKQDLAHFITLEAGKITQEALGEVQEWIDVCDFAVGLSRQLYGLTIASERPEHRMMEQWHPLGPVGIITAFNFPMAPWAWNAMLALVCGDTLIWKPSEKTPLSALAAHRVVQMALETLPDLPRDLSAVIVGGTQVGAAMAEDRRVPLISATGSVPMGRKVAQTVGARLGRTVLELGGNNAIVVAPSARLDLALKGIVFAAVGTAGQRCTTLRRLIVHESIAERLADSLRKAYASLPIGDPRDSGTLVGPLIDERALETMSLALDQARNQGGRLICGGERVRDGVPAGGVYVRPAIVEIEHDADIVREETFAPVLWLIRYRSMDQAITINNEVPQGFSSAIFTEDLREAERFLSPIGSDCGIANVNIGTSGAEIGGAFGGEKDTGGGRETGSDAWKNYMRRATNTINYGDALPLAQGIRFEI